MGKTFISFLSHRRIIIPSAKSLQSCPTLCDPTDGSWPGSPVPGILQARTLEWVAISFSNAWKWKVKVKLFSCFRLFATPWIAAHQAPPSMGFSRQEYWSGVPLPSPNNTLRFLVMRANNIILLLSCTLPLNFRKLPMINLKQLSFFCLRYFTGKYVWET